MRKFKPKRRFDEDDELEQLREQLLEVVQNGDGETLQLLADALGTDGFDKTDPSARLETNARDNLPDGNYREARKFSETEAKSIAGRYFDRFSEDLRQGGFNRKGFLDDFASLTPANRNVMTAEYQRQLHRR